MHYRAAPYNDYNEPYYGASQGYAPGEKEQFLGMLLMQSALAAELAAGQGHASGIGVHPRGRRTVRYRMLARP